ncbi:sensor histidine kinase [Rubricoccus marinus]|uniref:sensor histidine kinase n=1 Tax=Rubricoccus marinus TaxID=716817 RepID=UPI001C52DCDE|nr:ATP-binding protein [Rubricoccus marinus]
MAVRLNRLALNAALPVAGAVALAACAGALAASGGAIFASLAVGLAVGLIAGAVSYRSVYARVARRLDLAREVLREARKRRFDALTQLPSGRDERDELDALIRQVYRAGRALQAEIERLEKLESYRREFLGDVSHELRTPMFAISGFAETLLDGALDDDRVRQRFVEKILSNANRLEALTRDLAQISKLETGRLVLETESFALQPLAMETIDALEVVASDADVNLSVRLPSAIPAVSADRERIRQVLTNLVENAVKYNESGGHVEIVARALPGGARVRVGVVDDGIGIPPEALPRLTERFFRVDKSRSRSQGGTGLGLAIVKHILEAHGTYLSVDSKPGYGSTFSFELDAAPEAELASGAGAVARAEAA